MSKTPAWKIALEAASTIATLGWLAYSLSGKANAAPGPPVYAIPSGTKLSATLTLTPAGPLTDALAATKLLGLPGVAVEKSPGVFTVTGNASAPIPVVANDATTGTQVVTVNGKTARLSAIAQG